MEIPSNKYNELNEIKDKLKGFERKFYSVAQTATDSIIITDQDSNILFFNKSAENCFGYTEDEILGKNIAMLMPKKYREGHRKGVERFIASEVPKLIGSTIEIEGLRKDGHVFPIELSLSCWKENEQYYFSGIIRDITHRKKDIKQLELLLSINEAINNSPDFFSALKITIEKVCKELGWELGEAWIPHEDKRHINFAPVWYVADEKLLDFIDESKNLVLELGEGMPGRVLEGKIEWRPDIGVGKTIFNRYQVASNVGLKTGLGIPILSDGKVIAGILFYKFETEEVDEHQKNIVLSIGAQLGSGLSKKKSEEQLKEREHFIKKVADSSPIIIHVYDLINNQSLYSNKELVDALGYTSDHITKMGDAITKTIVHPDDFSKVLERNTLLEQAKDGEIIESEMRVKHSNGEWRWIFTRSTIFLRTSEGKAWQSLSISMDITEKKNVDEKLKLSESELRKLSSELEAKVKERTKELLNSQESLKQSENLLKIIANTIPAFVAYIDKNQIYKFANKYYHNLLFIEGEIVGKTVRSVLGDELYESNKPHLEKALKGESTSFASQIRAKDGSLKYFNVSYITDKNVKGEVKGLVVLGIDITDIVSYEKDLENKNSQLLKINTDLDNFIYTASHDLKAPIANIEGLISSLLETLSDQTNSNEEFNLIIKMIRTSIEKFKVTIQDLADISRAQRNITEGNSIVDLCKLIEDIIIEIGVEKSDGIINIETKNCPFINYPKNQLRSIIYNLLSNSLKFKHPERKAEIEIISDKLDEFAVLTVTDNGIGIQKEKINDMFVMFKRLHDHVEGTGIGLYIVKRIVENHGGKIEVESKVGKGTTFKVYFKLNE